jgi:hypothetical protein
LHFLITLCHCSQFAGVSPYFLQLFVANFLGGLLIFQIHGWLTAIYVRKNARLFCGARWLGCVIDLVGTILLGAEILQEATHCIQQILLGLRQLFHYSPR